ncbi:hypothetical protein I4U23_007227 [Adineta vaga]|nr:hypothetical protein I4U23_007227 [Adineta vaga]
MNNLYVIFDSLVCIYSIDDILQAFRASKNQCQAGNGYRLDHIVDSVEIRAKCEKTLEQNRTEINECTWQAYRTNTYVDGMIGAIGQKIYDTMAKNIKIRFIFAQDNIVIISTSERKVLKFIRSNRTILYLLHEAIYYNEPFNSQYVIDYEHESLIFAVGSELHRYAYNSCSIYETCRSCIGSRRYDVKSCIWFDGKCSLSSNSLIFNRGCPPSIDQIKPRNINLNHERISLTIKGLFEGVQTHLVNVTVKFPTLNYNQTVCTIETIENDSLTCNLTIPKQPVNGILALDIKPNHSLALGDTDISGFIELNEKLNIYIPKPILVPDFGPAAGGTKIRIQNLAFDNSLDLFSTMNIFLGNKQCDITEVTSDEIECINQACSNNLERLELSIQVNNNSWQIEKTYFQCRTDPIISDWYPKKSILSGGFKLTVNGQHLDVVQMPMMKFVYNISDYEFISLCESISSSQMICLSPAIDKNLGLNPPIDLDVTFFMDNIKIIPDNNILTIIDDPIYYPFKDYIQEINSTNIIKFQGANLDVTHSMDLIDVQIDHIHNACIPFNLTNTYLMCTLSKAAMNNLKDSEANIDIHIGTNLTFLIGKIVIQNHTQSTLLLSIPYLTKQIGSWTILILIILTSITILSLLFVFVIFIRRRYFQFSEKYHKQTKPPQYYQDVWCELGKKWQIHPKYLTLAEKIGQGCFGDVYRGELKQTDNKSLEVAIKVLRDQNVASMHEFLFEANRMKDFSHPNVLSLIGVVWDPVRKAMVLLPYMKNGDLRSYISNEKNRPTVRQLITWGIQVADGMEYLSALKFIHRDLATRNCMLDENLICRISDFGLSRDIVDRDYYLVPRTTTKEKNGLVIQMPPRRLPIRWLSPESIESSKYTIQSDVWSYGVLLWELLSRGKTPYPGIDNADIFTYVKNGYRLPQPTYCPPLLYKSAMFLCWNTDPSQRPSFAKLAQDIRHILQQLELEQQKHNAHYQPSSSADDDDTTIVQRYPADRKINRLSTTSLSSSASTSGQYITTPHRQSENIQLLFDRGGDDEDAYAVAVNSSADVFSTTRLLPRYTEVSIADA